MIKSNEIYIKTNELQKYTDELDYFYYKTIQFATVNLNYSKASKLL